MHIDAHIHFWKYDKNRDAWITNAMKVLQQDYLPGQLAQSLKRNGMDACVAVQADQSELETHFLVELAKTNEIIKGIVGWVDLRSENVDERLRYFSQFPIVKGWRHIVQAEPEGFLADKNFQRAVALLQGYGYTYDLLVYHHQLKAVFDFVSVFPEQKFVLDHCAKPDIRNKNIEEWKSWITKIADCKNVYCKLSGLFTEANWGHWSAADFYPYLDVVFEAFGVDRLMFGSDWPVILLSGIYVQWKSLIEKYMEQYAPEDKDKVFGGNAVYFYGL